MSGWDIGSDLIHITLVYATALMFGALGGLWSERSGVVNIAIEGMMTIGAFTGAVVTYFAGSPWIGFVAAAVAGAIFALPHAVASVTYKADQTISGVALNFLAVGLGLYLTKLIFDGQGQSPNLASGGTSFMISKVQIPLLSDIPFFGHAFFEAYPTTYIALALMLVTWYILFKTPWGLRIRAVGEHPKAADTAGVNVYLVRYMAVLTSGAFAAMGGATLALTTTASFSHSTVAGQGYIALAALIFGKWHPIGAVAAAAFFGVVTAVKFLLPYIGLGHVPLDIISMLPYALTLIVLVSFIGRATAPLASGVPYEKGSR
ncbi:ABC transporter permease [Paenibacillus sp.]|uniref:ABC transporter permease n=1 Tax=Paenibacillus sp. TaxID=58172 RepID=UPI00281247CA|nr:ABC transporter permease [Paenibacillus sp.]